MKTGYYTYSLFRQSILSNNTLHGRLIPAFNFLKVLARPPGYCSAHTLSFNNMKDRTEIWTLPSGLFCYPFASSETGWVSVHGCTIQIFSVKTGKNSIIWVGSHIHNTFLLLNTTHLLIINYTSMN